MAKSSTTIATIPEVVYKSGIVVASFVDDSTPDALALEPTPTPAGELSLAVGVVVAG